MRKIQLIILLLSVTVWPVYAAKIKTGEELITAMHKKYAGKWYQTLTFVQKTTQYKADGTTQVSTWYEAMSVPGKLRIDFDPLEDGNGIMFLDGTQHNFIKGKLARSQLRLHPLLVLGFDVYAQPVEKTLGQIKELKIDLSVLHEELWQNRPVYVVGAKQGDLSTPQFWIDKKNLYFVRLFELGGKDGKQVMETQFNKYQEAKGGGWVSAEVIFSVDGKTAVTEEYTDIQTGVTLDNNLFTPEKWMEADRKYFQKKSSR